MLAVLLGAAPAGAYPDTRDRLAKWPRLQAEVLENARTVAERLDPWAVRDGVLAPEPVRVWLAPTLTAYGRAWLGLDEWVGEVEHAAAELDRGLAEAGRGATGVDRLRDLHWRLVEAYSGRRHFNVRGGA